jgi:hypothetical protein
MKLLIVCTFALLSATGSLYAYEEWSLPNITAPTVIQPFALEAQIQHQFLGRIDGDNAFGRFFGLGDGADASIAIRSVIWSTAQVYATYDNIQNFNHSRNEFSVGTAYALLLPRIYVSMQADAQLFTYSSYLTYPEERHTNAFVLYSLQNYPLFDRVVFIANGGYDFDVRRFGLGLGIDVKVFRALDVIGTVFPLVDKSGTAASGQPAPGDVKTPFSFGVKVTTKGHQFFFTLSNATEMGPRHLMRGTTDNHLKFGFMLKRLFSFPWQKSSGGSVVGSTEKP